MLLFENNDQVRDIYHKAISLTISKEFAELSHRSFSQVDKQNSEQENRRRELLEVEEQANQNRLIEEHGKAHFRKQVMDKLFTHVNSQVDQAFDSKENLYNNILNIEDAAPAIMEILAVRAASIKRIAPLVSSLPWLANELINLVNKPQYRKRADVQVTDSNLALTYVGLDNLKLVMPTFMLKHWLPATTSPYPLMKRKLWNDSLSIALASQVLAAEQGLDKFSAFAAGMLSNIGLLAVAKCFIQTYNDAYKQEVQTAYNERDKRLHDILVEFDMAPELLHQQIVERSAIVTADIVELMRFDRLAITEPLFDLAYTNKFSDLSALARVIAKARAYVSFRSLAKNDLINNDEAKTILSAAHLTPAEVALLKKSDIDHIKLQFN